MTADEATGETVTITFEGRPVVARRGESLAAALTRAGERAFRITESGGDRGIFCGMGVCQECLVEVDGEPNRRACMTKVAGPHAVRRQGLIDPLAPAQAARPTEPVGLAELPVETPEVLVVGGGAAGLTAAASAAEAGADVVLIDERPAPGGQFFKQPAVGPADTPAHDDAQFAGGRRLIARAREAGVRFVSGAEVWGAFPPRELAVLHGGRSRIFRPQRLIVATGAYERALPVPGWTLPGAMTTGAAQTLWRSYRTLPGRRVLVAGNGPLNLQVALELARGGAEVAAVAEMAAPPRDPATAFAMLRASPGLAARGAVYLARLRLAGVPVLYRRVVAAIEQAADGLTVRLAPIATPDAPSETFTVDAVCMGYGFQPQNDILRALGCRHDFDPARGHLATRRDENCATTVEHVWAAGDCCGLGGAPAAADEGVIAGLAAARSLGRTVPERLAAEERAARRRMPRHRAFQQALWQLFAAPRLHTEMMTPDTYLCRCEEVTLAAVEAALAEGAEAIGEVKRATRLGMGRCQGRYCAPVLAHLLAARYGTTPDEYALFAPRAPVKPIAIADLVGGGR